MSAPPENWEEQSTARPPLFNGQYYSWWKNMIRDHIIGEDYELWDIVTDGPLATLKINAEGIEMSTTESKVVQLLSKFGTHCKWLMKEHLRRQTMKMDIKKERSVALRITEGSDLEDDEMAMITKDFKKYPR
ncbi:uncharacterized protein [Nicotiana tomentosiformis]|uniref:uncharacterized protein n=1 Tax=Nicotiana tomentosiformis TaxID=4098 RepID=UPI00388C793E